MQMKTTAEFKEESAAHKALQAQNTHPHKHGIAGYAGKILQLRDQDQQANRSNVSPSFAEITDERARSWLIARASVTSSSDISFTNKADEEVSQCMVNMSNYLVVNKSITSYCP